MENTTIYTGIYKDASKELPIEIANDTYDLSFSIEGLKFTSIDLEEWTLVDENEYTEEQLDKFTLGTYTSPQGVNLVTKHLLKDCEIHFSIPQQMLNKTTVKEANIDLNISITLNGSEAKVTLSLKNENVNEEVKDIVDFDAGLKKINNSISKKIILFNCYNCRLSSYNIYGQSLFGSLLCYKKHKERFLKTKDKSDYLSVQNQGYDTVQETYCCEEFQLPAQSQFLYK